MYHKTMNQEKPFAGGFQNPDTGESVFGEVNPMEMKDEDEGEEEADGIEGSHVHV